ncbi:vitamin K epoxide reductase family protein [Arachidicoccus sp.]|uniref:vitamin K epoxide reductase family protein n=1 Tax=Arachidicoccus sp. TaxID=1872624 RepID=UPI003D1999FA
MRLQQGKGFIILSMMWRTKEYLLCTRFFCNEIVGEDSEYSEEWKKELDHRHEAYKKGKSTLISPQVFKNIFNPMQNCELVTFRLCRELNVPVTKSKIAKDLQEHPNYPSLLSIKDILNDVGVQSLALSSVAIERLERLSIPAIAQVKINKQDNFVVITSITTENVQYFHPTQDELITSSLAEFDQLFTGFILLVEADETASEKDYTIHYREEKRQYFSKLISALAIPAFTLIACILVFMRNGIVSLQAIIFTLLTLVGTITGSLLLWYEVDQYNPALQKICSAGKKTNCGAILHSKASKIFGISWSVIGFTYFSGSLIGLLVTGIYQMPNLFILSWLNVIALPYIAFSLYYQAKIAKQWCVLCLSVQGILASQFVVALWGGFHSFNALHFITASTIVAIIISFIIPFLLVSRLLPALRKAKESKGNKIELQRLKHNPQVFEALLAKQKGFTESTEGLGITLGNPNATFKLLKVCNPYCDPCAKAHPAMEALLDNNPDVQIQIIFTANGEENDIKTPPVKHLLAIAEKSEEDNTKQGFG